MKLSEIDAWVPGDATEGRVLPKGAKLYAVHNEKSYALNWSTLFNADETYKVAPCPTLNGSDTSLYNYVKVQQEKGVAVATDFRLPFGTGRKDFSVLEMNDPGVGDTRQVYHYTHDSMDVVAHIKEDYDTDDKSPATPAVRSVTAHDMAVSIESLYSSELLPAVYSDGDVWYGPVPGERYVRHDSETYFMENPDELLIHVARATNYTDSLSGGGYILDYSVTDTDNNTMAVTGSRYTTKEFAEQKDIARYNYGTGDHYTDPQNDTRTHYGEMGTIGSNVTVEMEHPNHFFDPAAITLSTARKWIKNQKAELNDDGDECYTLTL